MTNISEDQSFISNNTQSENEPSFLYVAPSYVSNVPQVAEFEDQT